MPSMWDTLPAQIFGLAPMDGVTDYPFREIQKKYGHPDVMYTEFTCVEGITHGAGRLLKDFLYSEYQRPVIAQVFGHTPEDFRTVATIVCQLGFDGIDINMGCPAKNVTHQGSGAALIQTPELAQDIVAATKAGVDDWYNGKTVDDLSVSPEIQAKVNERSRHFHEPRTIIAELSDFSSGQLNHKAIIDSENNKGWVLGKLKRHKIPVSIKTRIGYDQPVIEEWIPILLETEPAAIAIHGRMLKQYYGGEANWAAIGKAAEIAKTTPTKILGNGDVISRKDGQQKIMQYGVDGVLIGRAAMGNPWVFSDKEVGVADRLKLAIEHAELYEHTFQADPYYQFLPMRKHLGWYVRGFDNASVIRQQLVVTNSADEVKRILEPVIQDQQ